MGGTGLKLQANREKNGAAIYRVKRISWRIHDQGTM